ncbi:MAG: porin family protein [Bacteroidota bacterium]|nr:porin family protein [Bacteroidota bacterium]
MTKLALILLCVLTSTTTNAQSSDTRENFSFGFKGGINRSNVWDEQGQDFRADAKTGLAAGLFIGIPIGATLGFQPELMLSQKGFRGSGTLLGTGYSLTRTSNFIDIPLQLQIKPVEALTILVGPQYSYLISQKDVYTFGANSTQQLQEFNNDNVRKNILGFVIGADINIKHLVVSGRLAWDIMKNNGDGTTTTPRYKNQLVQLTLGYKI